MKHPDEPEPVKPPKPGSVQDKCQKSWRAMIYVHAKLMIMDEKYVIIGSANINQVSVRWQTRFVASFCGTSSALLFQAADVVRGSFFLPFSTWVENVVSEARRSSDSVA